MEYQVYNGSNWLMRNHFPDRDQWHGRFKLRVLLLFDKEELKYDIANVAYVQGDVARVNDNYGHDLLGEDREHLMHQWKDVCEEGNYDRVLRTENLAVSEVEQMLYRYTARAIWNHVSMDNQQEKKQEFAIELMTPRGFSETTCVYLLNLIHEYIVSRVLADWASITYPEVQQRWEMKYMDAAEKIKVAASMCGDPVHRVNPTII